MMVQILGHSNELKRRMRNKIVLLFVFLLLGFHVFSQTKSDELSILFYNVENLFDTVNDPITADDEFVPNGGRYWTNKRLNRKLQNISKVILSASEWSMPAVIALCEIENKDVLEKLIRYTPLKTNKYKIIHKESPDHRGIDVAFLYDPSLFYPLHYQHIPLRDVKNRIKRTREILYVKGVFNKNDTVHFFVNHWPSRYGGLMETKPERNRAAAALRKKTDELYTVSKTPKIVIVGDFNDQPEDESLAEVLRANKITGNNLDSELYNLSYDWRKDEEGTLKFRSQWQVYDQIIVSGAFLNASEGLVVKAENASILRLPFLLENDEDYGGEKLRRTYYGYTYLGGFSDHLPVLLKLEITD